MVGHVLLLRTKLGKRFAIATVLSEELEEAPGEELRIGAGSLEGGQTSSSTRLKTPGKPSALFSRQ